MQKQRGWEKFHEEEAEILFTRNLRITFHRTILLVAPVRFFFFQNQPS